MRNLTLILSLILSSSAFAEVIILSERKEDLNKDGKKDSIAWVAKSKEDKRPSRLVIRMPGKVLLDISGNFCAPNEKASDCIHLDVQKRLTPRKEPLLIFKSDESTYTYRWSRGGFHPYLASYVTKNERVEINYTSGRALISSAKKADTCPLKKSRVNEKLSDFSLYDIRDEADCANK